MNQEDKVTFHLYFERDEGKKKNVPNLIFPIKYDGKLEDVENYSAEDLRPIIAKWINLMSNFVIAGQRKDIKQILLSLEKIIHYLPDNIPVEHFFHLTGLLQDTQIVTCGEFDSETSEIHWNEEDLDLFAYSHVEEGHALKKMDIKPYDLLTETFQGIENASVEKYMVQQNIASQVNPFQSLLMVGQSNESALSAITSGLSLLDNKKIFTKWEKGAFSSSKLEHIIIKEIPTDGTEIVTSSQTRGKKGLIAKIFGKKEPTDAIVHLFDRNAKRNSIYGYIDKNTKEFWCYKKDVEKFIQISDGPGHRRPN